MQRISIEALARQQLTAAVGASSGRAGDTVVGGHEKVLRQTVVALRAGARIAERENHDEATIFVLSGRVRMWSGDVEWLARSGHLLIVPPARHGLDALEDATLLITVAKLRD
ncbi:MAG TPA: LuxR family transcriptional regulator [Actinomycetaceae bacterium]|nr:LuxR family transcriptional regulator [Actinomycetaceae bacterium]